MNIFKKINKSLFIAILFILFSTHSIYSQNVSDLRIFSWKAHLFIDGVNMGVIQGSYDSPYIVKDLSVGQHTIKAVVHSDMVFNVEEYEIFNKTIEIKYGVPNSLDIEFNRIYKNGSLRFLLDTDNMPHYTKNSSSFVGLFDGFTQAIVYDICKEAEEFFPSEKSGYKYYEIILTLSDGNRTIKRSFNQNNRTEHEIIGNRRVNKVVNEIIINDIPAGEYTGRINGYIHLTANRWESNNNRILSLFFGKTDKNFNEGFIERKTITSHSLLGKIERLNYYHNVNQGGDFTIKIEPNIETTIKVNVDSKLNIRYEVF